MNPDAATRFCLGASVMYRLGDALIDLSLSMGADPTEAAKRVLSYVEQHAASRKRAAEDEVKRVVIATLGDLAVHPDSTVRAATRASLRKARKKAPKRRAKK